MKRINTIYIPKRIWEQYPGVVDVWVRNWKHAEQLFNYGSVVRKVMYTTNAIELVNSSFWKATKKGSFPSEDAVRKALYLRITELYKKMEWQTDFKLDTGLETNPLWMIRYKPGFSNMKT